MWKTRRIIRHDSREELEARVRIEQPVGRRSGVQRQVMVSEIYCTLGELSTSRFFEYLGSAAQTSAVKIPR